MGKNSFIQGYSSLLLKKDNQVKFTRELFYQSTCLWLQDYVVPARSIDQFFGLGFTRLTGRAGNRKLWFSPNIINIINLPKYHFKDQHEFVSLHGE